MAVRGETGWKATYQKAFGKERWPALGKALKAPIVHVSLVNPFLPAEAQAQFRAEHRLLDHESIPGVCLAPQGEEAQEDAEDEEGLAVLPCEVLEEGLGSRPTLPCYYLDAASVIAALALAVRPGDRVLDLCAAPGGKSLVLACALFGPRRALEEEGPGGRESRSAEAEAEALEKKEKKTIPAGGLLVCNESSRPRALRLQRVLSSFLPQELLGHAAAGGRVAVTIADASGSPPLPVQRLGPFDKVLVDAPCTSDRHLARQGKAALSRWALGAVRANADRQLELLKSASQLVRPGGSVLYCTCALSEQENDGVVAKFLKLAKAQGRDFEVVPPSLMDLPDGTDATGTGALILPDRTAHGPIFFAQLLRGAS